MQVSASYHACLDSDIKGKRGVQTHPSYLRYTTRQTGLGVYVNIACSLMKKIHYLGKNGKC